MHGQSCVEKLSSRSLISNENNTDMHHERFSGHGFFYLVFRWGWVVHLMNLTLKAVLGRTPPKNRMWRGLSGPVTTLCVTSSRLVWFRLWLIAWCCEIILYLSPGRPLEAMWHSPWQTNPTCHPAPVPQMTPPPHGHPTTLQMTLRQPMDHFHS